jgi:DNA-binding MarR family transcriptional regulator
MATIQQATYDQMLYSKGVASGLYGSIPRSAIEDSALGTLELGILAFIIAGAAGKGVYYEKRSTSLAYLDISKARYEKTLKTLQKHKYISIIDIPSKNQLYDPAHKIILTRRATHPSKCFSIVRQSVMWSSLSLHAKALYVVLACKEDAAMEIIKPVDYLAHVLQISENTIIKYTKELIEYGLIEREKRKKDPETKKFTESVTTLKEHPQKITPLPCPTSNHPTEKADRKKPSAKTGRFYKRKELSLSKGLPYGDKTIMDCLPAITKTRKTVFPDGAITREMINQHKAKAREEYRDLCARYPTRRIPAPNDAEIEQIVVDKIAQATAFHGIGQIPAFERKHDLFIYLLSHADPNEETAVFVARALEALLTQTVPIRLPGGAAVTAEEYRTMLNQIIVQNYWRSGTRNKANSPVADTSALIHTLEDYAERARYSMEFNEVKNPIAYVRAIILADL